MGGLFSRNETSTPTSESARFPPAPAPTSYTVKSNYSYTTPASTLRYNSPRAYPQTYDSNRLPTPTPAPTRPLASAILRHPHTHNWNLGNVPVGRSSYNRVSLNRGDGEYIKVQNTFQRTAQKHMNVIKIERVENPFLMCSFVLKKEELQNQYGVQAVKETEQFHGTKGCNANSICENNFNWRMHGTSLGNRFGQGISFSPIATYASHYCDKGFKGAKDEVIKIMFLVRVLVSKSFEGSLNMTLPPPGFDTTHKQDGKVIVKFYDNEFYPEYIIHFTGSPITYNKK